MKKILLFVIFALLFIGYAEAKSSGYAIIPFPRNNSDQSFSFHRGRLVSLQAGDILIEKIRLPGKISDLFQDNAGWVLGVARAGEIGMYKSNQPEGLSNLEGKRTKELDGIVWFSKEKGEDFFSKRPTGFLVRNRNHFANITFYFKDRRKNIYECKVLKVLPEGLEISYKLIEEI